MEGGLLDLVHHLHYRHHLRRHHRLGLWKMQSLRHHFGSNSNDIRRAPKRVEAEEEQSPTRHCRLRSRNRNESKTMFTKRYHLPQYHHHPSQR